MRRLERKSQKCSSFGQCSRGQDFLVNGYAPEMKNLQDFDAVLQELWR